MAIVLGLSVNGLGVLRSLGPRGVRCAGIYADARTERGVHSRYLARTACVRTPTSDAEVWRALDELSAGERGRPVLIPTADVYADFISRNRMRLAERFAIRCPDSDIYAKFLDKGETIDLCAAHGMPTPPSVVPRSEAEVATACETLRFPVIVKPRTTFAGRFPGKNFVADTPDVLQSFLRERADLVGHVIVQEIIPSGDGRIVVSAVYSGGDGRVAATYVGRKLRQFLPDYGVTCLGVSEWDDEAAASTRRFLDAIAYKGFAALEFARDRRSGALYFLELNPRTFYHNQLFADAGVDLTLIGYLDMAGGDVGPHLPDRQRDGIVWLDFGSDVRSFIRKRRAREITFAEWGRSLTRASSFAYWNARDPKPFFVSCWRLISDAGARLVHGPAVPRPAVHDLARSH